MICLYFVYGGVFTHMFKTVGIYKNIKDLNKFEEYYTTIVFPFLLNLPGVCNIRVSTLIPTGHQETDEGSVKMLFETYYESAEALEQIMSSEQGEEFVRLILQHNLAEFESYIGTESVFENMQ